MHWHISAAQAMRYIPVGIIRSLLARCWNSQCPSPILSFFTAGHTEGLCKALFVMPKLASRIHSAAAFSHPVHELVVINQAASPDGLKRAGIGQQQIQRILAAFAERMMIRRVIF